ncbi:uncharacterized protein [Cardiocondyla obscurior]
MEEDTELRDLVVQTLESNGVLAKIRAELRASVFLALEEQDSVMNPEPLLNKTVKQYLSNSEGKLLFSLVREFLEYFGLDYTISVYDPETYFGKEYNYVGRNKLCEELGIDSTEPLLGEILKNSINGAFNSSQKNKTSSRHDETDETTTNFANATFEVSVPKIIHNESVSSSNDNDSSEKLESISEQSPKIPINVTITDKKCNVPSIDANVVADTSGYDKHQFSLRENTMDTDGIEGNRNNNINFDKSTANPHGTCTATNDVAQETDNIITSNQTSPLNKSESLIKFDNPVVIDTQANQNEDITKQNSINSLELSIENNVQSKKPINAGNNFGKTIYFDEIIVGGERKNVSTMNKAEPFLEGLPTINQKANSIFSDLPPLNGKKANINDLKELMNIGLAADGIDNYEEDFVSSASGSANEQSPSKEPDKINSPLKLQTKKEEKPQSAEDISEEIEEIDEILSSTSCQTMKTKKQGRKKKTSKVNLRAKTTDKIMTSKKLKTQICKTKKMFLRKLQEAMNGSYDGRNRNLSNSDQVLRKKMTKKLSSKKASPALVSAVFHTNTHNEDIKRDNNMCYRCQHFLQLPRNLSQAFSSKPTFLEQYKEELNFVQAIVWLKAVTVYTYKIPIEQLQKIFDKQWNSVQKHSKNTCTYRKQLNSLINYDLASQKTITKDTFVTSTPLDNSNASCSISQNMNLYTGFQDARNKSLIPVSENDQNKSVTQLLKLKSSNNFHIVTREKEIEVGALTLSKIEESLSENDRVNDIPEHQPFILLNNAECNVQDNMQSTSKYNIEQINKEIFENEHILQSSNGISEFISPINNQSTYLTFNSQNNLHKERSISIKSQNNLTDKTFNFNNSLKSLTITQKDISQMSKVNNKEYFAFLFEDDSLLQSNNVKTSQKDSAYSTSRYNMFNYYDTEVETGINVNKRLSDTDDYCTLQPCKKQINIYETEKAFDDSSKSLNITQKNISQISNICNDSNSDFHIVCSYDRLSNISPKNVSNNVAMVMASQKSIDDKSTLKAEDPCELYPYNEKKIISEEVIASASITQQSVTQATNIELPTNNERPNNFPVYNDRKVNNEKVFLSSVTDTSEKCESELTQNDVLEEQNTNENKMLSVDWLNFTLESLCVERIIINSIEVILSVLCDKKMIEEYMIKERIKNTRNYWKDSLEEEAINAVLNISDIFITEKKPNICLKVIMTTIIKAINEMTMYTQLNKTYHMDTKTSVSIYRLQIILEFCNSLPICVKVIDYLITRIKFLQSGLTNRNIDNNTYVMINQLHLVFYALNITVRKYCTIIPSKLSARPMDKIMTHVTDLWKMQYIDKEIKNTDLDLNDAEKRWLTELENIVVIFTKHFTQFAQKLYSLIHILISRSHTKKTQNF